MMLVAVADFAADGHAAMLAVLPVGDDAGCLLRMTSDAGTLRLGRGGGLGLLAGDRKLFKRFVDATLEVLDPLAFLQAKTLEQRQRHARHDR